MSEAQRAPKTRFDTHVWWFLFGLTVFGIFGFALFFAGSSAMAAISIVAIAVLMAGITLGAALWAFRRHRIDFGSGLLAGYAVAAVASEGQCTFLAPARDYAFIGGFFVYLITISGVFLIAVIATTVSLILDQRRGN